MSCFCTWTFRACSRCFCFQDHSTIMHFIIFWDDVNHDPRRWFPFTLWQGLSLQRLSFLSPCDAGCTVLAKGETKALREGVWDLGPWPWQGTELGFVTSLPLRCQPEAPERTVIAEEMLVAGCCLCWDTSGTGSTYSVKRYSRGSKSLSRRLSQSVLGLTRIKF